MRGGVLRAAGRGQQANFIGRAPLTSMLSANPMQELDLHEWHCGWLGRLASKCMKIEQCLPPDVGFPGPQSPRCGIQGENAGHNVVKTTNVENDEVKNWRKPANNCQIQRSAGSASALVMQLAGRTAVSITHAAGAPPGRSPQSWLGLARGDAAATPVTGSVPTRRGDMSCAPRAHAARGHPPQRDVGTAVSECVQPRAACSTARPSQRDTHGDMVAAWSRRARATRGGAVRRFPKTTWKSSVWRQRVRRHRDRDATTTRHRRCAHAPRWVATRALRRRDDETGLRRRHRPARIAVHDTPGGAAKSLPSRCVHYGNFRAFLTRGGFGAD